MAKHKKIKILAYAKFQTLIFALVGLVTGLIYSVGGALFDLLTIGINQGTFLAYGALVGMPLYFGVFGLVSGLLGAFLYNLILSSLARMSLNFER